ncbi:hypothetical protein [Ornithinibacillus halophilus]|uniref:LPXTG-motif cell wall anchor domain-containing protein n=1 Tax=Ornithinibacillus halophilus TaxID=930117 RepID=A0A1M5FEN1_9BACI|nr:hypothetical protein [Ornithinibacillus halophilus]SHF89592.1 hypothetical protein SAMN05216225_100842 [Ornithinibacillus halophilus]
MKKIIIISFVLIILFSITGIKVNADGTGENSSNEGREDFNLNISPGDVLFNITNMKPGDWAPRSITIQNTGREDFSYQMTLTNNGSDKLFNEFILEINDSEGELYNGRLAEFSSLPVRHLAASSEEVLDVTVRMPEHLGNEYQGLDSQFTLTFTASGENNDKKEEKDVTGNIGSTGDSDSSGSPLPDTATNIFNILLIGGILLTIGILFSIVATINKIKVNKKKRYL